MVSGDCRGYSIVVSMTNKTITSSIGRLLLIPVLLLLVSCATTGGAGPYPEYYSAKPIQGRIVDGLSGEPVAGAAVLVSWWVEYMPLSTAIFAFGHSETTKKLLVVEESITDKDGNYQIPGWEPVSAGGALIVPPWAPRVFIYKQGYDRGVILNHDEYRRPFNNLKTEELGFLYNRKDIKLYPYGKKPKKDLGNYDPSVKEPTKQDIEVISISRFVSHIKHTIDDSDDPADTMKKMVQSMLMADDEMKRIREKYPKKYFGSWGGSKRKYIQNHRKNTPGQPSEINDVTTKDNIIPCYSTGACSDVEITPIHPKGQ